MAISWKWSNLAQNWPTRQICGTFQHLGNFLSPGTKTVCSIGFENSISFNPGRSGFCSSLQCWRTRLELQLCQLRHPLIRLGLGDNYHRSRSVRQPSFSLNQSRARRRGRPAAEFCRHLASVRRSWPRSSAPSVRLSSTATPRAKWTRPFALPRPLSPETRPQRAHLRELPPASLCALLAASQSTKLRPQLHREPLSTLHPLTRRETHRWAAISFFPKSGRCDLLPRRTQCRASRSLSSPLVRF